MHTYSYIDTQTEHTWMQTLNYMHTHAHSCTQYGHTALYFAAHYGHEDVVELLLEAEADPDIADMVISINFDMHYYKQVLHNVLCLCWIMFNT